MKNRKILLIISVLLLSSLLLSTFSSCASNNYVAYTLAYKETKFNNHKPDANIIVNDYSEWLESIDYYSLDDLNGKFDEVFFDKKSLIIINKYFPSTNGEYSTAEIIKKDGELEITIYVERIYTTGLAVICEIVIFEVKKSSIKGYSNINAEFKTEE